MSVTTIAGKNVSIYKRTSTSPDVWALVVCGVDASLSITKDIIESKNKCGTIRAAGDMSWEMGLSLDANTTPGATEITDKELFDDMKADTTGHYAFKSADDDFGYEGDAIITKMDYKAGTDGLLSLDATLSGSGDVERMFDDPQLADESLIASVISSTQINLTWNAITHATGYVLERASDANFLFGRVVIYTGSATSYNNTGLTTATHYYYRVKATAPSYTDSAWGLANAITS